MSNLSLTDKIILTAILFVIIGVMAWMVSQSYIAGSVLYGLLVGVFTTVVGILFHSSGVAAALATPSTTPTTTTVP